MRFQSFAIVAFLLTAPAIAYAQASIAGSTTDSSGDPVAGVFVEVSGPALIEKARAIRTDSGGRYRIDDLRPGIYQVRFMLAGWRSYLRNGVVLSGSTTARVDAELAIGGVSEKVTVPGRALTVDVQSATNVLTLTGDLIESVPTVRTYNALLGLVPGVVTSANDVVLGTATTSFPVHGGRSTEGRLMVDGFTIGSPPSGNSATSYSVNGGHAQEVVFTIGGPLGESETAGLVMNLVPKSGGNTTHGSIFASGSGKAFQSDNVTRALGEQGVVAATPLTNVYDMWASLGGPVARDRAWYFIDGHVGGNTRESVSVFHNLNAGNETAWLYAPDVSRRSYSDRTFESVSGRVTWQVTPRNKVGGFWDAQALCRRCTGATPGLSEPLRTSPEAVGVLSRPLHVTQLTWSAPWTDRLFFDAGFSGTFFGVGNFEREPNPTRQLVRVVEQCANGCDANGGIPGLVYRSQDFSVANAGSYLWKSAVSFVSGSRSLKIGFQHTLMTDDRTWMTNDEHLTYRVSNGLPNQLTQSISPWVNDAHAAWDGLFLQGRWTHQRLTLQGAVRWDWARSWYPAQQEGPSRFLPTAIIIPETRGVDSYRDVTPRLGGAYDLFGNGRTALRATVAKYLEGAGIAGTYANANPTLRLPRTTTVFGTAGVTRTWIDANRNFVPDCNLSNVSAHDMRSAGGDLCGVLSNTSFGQYVLTNNFDANILDGWGVRPSDLNLDLSMEHQILPNASVAVTYTRRWFRGFFAVDNLRLEPADFRPFSVVAPVDARLPGGGGYVVSGLYDVAPDKAGQVDSLVTSSANYGKWRQHFTGLDVTISVRDTKGLTIAAGASTGQTVADNCEVRARLPELATTTIGTSAFGGGLLNSAVTPLSPYCSVEFGMLPQLRGLATYRLPLMDIQLSAAFQSKPGALLAAQYTASAGEVAPALGRPLSGQASNVTVNLVPPGTMYGDRINELDVRVAKSLRFGRLRAVVGIEVYNALNSSAVLTYDTTYVPDGPWLQPLAILTPRVLKITGDVDF